MAATLASLSSGMRQFSGGGSVGSTLQSGNVPVFRMFGAISSGLEDILNKYTEAAKASNSSFAKSLDYAKAQQDISKDILQQLIQLNSTNDRILEALTPSLDDLEAAREMKKTAAAVGATGGGLAAVTPETGGGGKGLLENLLAGPLDELLVGGLLGSKIKDLLGKGSKTGAGVGFASRAGQLLKFAVGRALGGWIIASAGDFAGDLITDLTGNERLGDYVDTASLYAGLGFTLGGPIGALVGAAAGLAKEAIDDYTAYIKAEGDKMREQYKKDIEASVTKMKESLDAGYTQTAAKLAEVNKGQFGRAIELSKPDVMGEADPASLAAAAKLAEVTRTTVDKLMAGTSEDQAMGQDLLTQYRVAEAQATMQSGGLLANATSLMNTPEERGAALKQIENIVADRMKVIGETLPIDPTDPDFAKAVMQQMSKELPGILAGTGNIDITNKQDTIKSIMQNAYNQAYGNGPAAEVEKAINSLPTNLGGPPTTRGMLPFSDTTNAGSSNFTMPDLGIWNSPTTPGAPTSPFTPDELEIINRLLDKGDELPEEYMDKLMKWQEANPDQVSSIGFVGNAVPFLEADTSGRKNYDPKTMYASLKPRNKKQAKIIMWNHEHGAYQYDPEVIAAAEALLGRKAKIQTDVPLPRRRPSLVPAAGMTSEMLTPYDAGISNMPAGSRGEVPGTLPYLTEEERVYAEVKAHAEALREAARARNKELDEKVKKAEEEGLYIRMRLASGLSYNDGANTYGDPLSQMSSGVAEAVLAGKTGTSAVEQQTIQFLGANGIQTMTAAEANKIDWSKYVERIEEENPFQTAEGLRNFIPGYTPRPEIPANLQWFGSSMGVSPIRPMASSYIQAAGGQNTQPVVISVPQSPTPAPVSYPSGGGGDVVLPSTVDQRFPWRPTSSRIND